MSDVHADETRSAFLQEAAERDPATVGSCPKCHVSWVWVAKRHWNGNGAFPECDYFECEQCGAQWGHS